MQSPIKLKRSLCRVTWLNQSKSLQHLSQNRVFIYPVKCLESNVVTTETAYSPPGALHWILCIDIARDAIQCQQGDENLDCIYYCMMIKGKSWNQCGELIRASSTCLKPFCLTVRKRRPLPISLCTFHWIFWGAARIGFGFSAFAQCFFNSTCLLLCWRHALIELQSPFSPGRVQILSQSLCSLGNARSVCWGTWLLAVALWTPNLSHCNVCPVGWCLKHKCVSTSWALKGERPSTVKWETGRASIICFQLFFNPY